MDKVLIALCKTHGHLGCMLPLIFRPSSEYGTDRVEDAVVYLLDSAGSLLDSMHFAGSVDRVALSLRQIVLRALECNCRGVILTHSHPSGDSKPSPEDVAVTRVLDRILAPLDIRLIDHVIEAAGETFSFYAHGLL